MDNVFRDSTFATLINAGYRIVSIFPHPDIVLHYIYEDLRTEDDETTIQAFPITEFLELHRGQTSQAAVMGLLTSYMDRNKMVVIKFHKISYITHAAL